jgi:uncharacterized protein (TIGR03083 family)
MDSDTIWRHVDEQRVAVADILAGLPTEAWAQTSLCEAWTVRDVAAHLTLAQAGMRQVIGPLLRSGFRFNTMIRETALRSPLGHDEIIATIRGFVGSRRRAVGVSEVEPLLDTLIHTQDICVPLGIEHPMPLDAAVVAADRVLTIRPPFRLRTPYRHVRFEATDADWAWGEGFVVRGPMQWLLLTLAGRTAAHQRLSGDLEALSGRRAVPGLRWAP